MLIDGLPGASLCARIVNVDGLPTLIAERPRQPVLVMGSGVTYGMITWPSRRRWRR